MSIGPPRPCSKHPQVLLVRKGRCPLCITHKREKDRERGTAASRGYDSRWRKIRLQVLADEPLCRFHHDKGEIVSAEVVDHIDGNSRNNSRDNLRPLCKQCHDQRTGRDQAWGRKEY